MSPLGLTVGRLTVGTVGTVGGTVGDNHAAGYKIGTVGDNHAAGYKIITCFDFIGY